MERSFIRCFEWVNQSFFTQLEPAWARHIRAKSLPQRQFVHVPVEDSAAPCTKMLYHKKWLCHPAGDKESLYLKEKASK